MKIIKMKNMVKSKFIILILIMTFLLSSCVKTNNIIKKNELSQEERNIENPKQTEIEYPQIENVELKFFPSAKIYEQENGRFLPKEIRSFVVLYGDKNTELYDFVSLVAKEFSERNIINAEPEIISVSELSKNKGNIVVRLVDGLEGISSKEGFSIEISDYILINALSPRAAMYALRALGDYFFVNGNLPYGTILDYPEVELRGLHLDMARKYFTPDWIKALIKDMSKSRLNTLQLHFSENEGFRLECETYPEIISDDYISKDEMRDILTEAKKYGVDILPAFDNPGHLRTALKLRPEFWLFDINGKQNKGSIDINNPQARDFVKNIIFEYSELFKDSEYFHIGGDEFVNFDNFDDYPSLAEFGQGFVDDGVVANGLDGYIAYINEIADYTESLGFKVRIWNDGVYRKNIKSHVPLNDDIEICYWTRWNENMASTDTLMEKGHKLVNVNDWMYYVLTTAKIYRDPPDAEELYKSWDNGYFAGIDYEMVQKYEMPNDNVLGSMFAIWCDHEEMQTQEEIADGIFYSLKAMAEKSWAGKRENADFDKWKKLIEDLKF